MFLKEVIAEPIVEVDIRVDAARGQELQQPLGRGVFPPDRWNADDAISI